MLKLSPTTYLIAFAVLASYSAVLGGFAYHKGAMSKAEEIGTLKANVQTEKDNYTACSLIASEQTARFKQMQEDAERRSAEAAKAAEQARLIASSYKKKAILISRMKPSTSCGEAAGRLRDQLRIERGEK